MCVWKKEIYCGYLLLFKKRRVSPIKSNRKGNHRNGFGFRYLSPNLSFLFLYYYYLQMFTLYYFIILKNARSVGLRICYLFRIWWECPWAKSRIKERVVRRGTGWHIPVQSATWCRTLVCWSDTLTRKTSGDTSKMYRIYRKM